ncbi:MAG: hypothetical protein LBU39_08540 [Desulfobulbaceae bacterium]|jgi:hypothetical protein|nr:hypothetical protein [Desulfobulbaceae bacterium]
MTTTRHAELLETIIGHLAAIPLLQTASRKIGILGDLDRDALLSFFDHGLCLGVFAQGGKYQDDASLRGQIEEVDARLIIGAIDLSADHAAALGGGGEPGCWEALEAIREFYAAGRWRQSGRTGNILAITMRAWRQLLAENGMAIISLELEVSLLRPVALHQPWLFDSPGPGRAVAPAPAASDQTLGPE